ncbi:MAG TPA: hypothetical protein VL651_15315 [Bacteroidia bacterium]|jgi:hypothetical protein|nr:hypothetical protein [Bacteroidia bacterium]
MISERTEFEHWETICSDLKDLYFVSLKDEKELVFTVRDNSNKYEFIFNGWIGPYLVSDESLRSSSTQISNPPHSRTFIIKNSDLIPLFNPGTFDVTFHNKTVRHYVIHTYDSCLEILTDKEPIVKATPLK